MTAIYEVRIYSRAGVRQATLTGQLGDPSDGGNDGYLHLSYVKAVNEIGNGMLLLNAESSAADVLAPDGEPVLDMQVEFWRRDEDNDIEPYCDFYGFLRDREYQTSDNGQIWLAAILEEQSDYLRRAIVAYRAGTANRSSFGAVAAETILKNLVKYNATASGTTGDGRDRNVDAWGAYISIQADGAAGTTLTRALEGRTLYDALKDIAGAGGLDFSLVKTGLQAWEFRTAALLGTDRSSGANTVTFSQTYGNMRVPSLRSNRRAEKTVAIVGGNGSDGNRPVQVRTSTAYNATYNSYEMWANGDETLTTAGLQAVGDARLEEVRARDRLGFDVIQVPSTLYGKHYFLGDKVRAHFLGKDYTPQIKRVSIDVKHRDNRNPEQILVVAEDA